MRLFQKKQPNNEDELRKMEMRLMTTLQPVLPRAEFVRELGLKLAEKEILITPKFRLNKKLSNGLLVAGGVIGSIIMILTSIRGLVSLIGVVSYLVHFLNKNAHRQHPSPV
jgi:hypothetical protein